MVNFLNKLELGNKKILLIIIICLVIIYIDWAFLIKSQLRGIEATREKIIKLNKDIDILIQDLATMQQTKIKQETAPKIKKIISEGQIPMLFQRISNLANKDNVKIMEMKPFKEAKASPNEKMTSVLVILDLYGGYHNLGKFINDLENAEELMGVEDLKISPQPADYFKQMVSLVLKTYVKQ